MEKKGEEPTLFLLTNPLRQGLYTQSCRKGKLLPSLSAKGSASSSERGMDNWAAPIFRCSTFLFLSYLHTTRILRGVFCPPASPPPSARTDTSTAPVPQPPGQRWWSSSKQRSLSSVSTLLCCSQGNFPYPSFKFSAAFYPADRLNSCTRNEISEKFLLKLCQLLVRNLLDSLFSCSKCLLFVMCWSNSRFCFDIFNKRTRQFNLLWVVTAITFKIHNSIETQHTILTAILYLLYDYVVLLLHGRILKPERHLKKNPSNFPVRPPWNFYFFLKQYSHTAFVRHAFMTRVLRTLGFFQFKMKEKSKEKKPT